MRLVYGHDDVVRALVSKLIGGYPLSKGPAIGVARADGELIGGFVYQNYNDQTGVIEISGASLEKKWLTRDVLYGLFGYPFDQLGCQLVIMQHRATDMAIVRMLVSYGFETVTIPRLYGREENGIISTLKDDVWRASPFHVKQRKDVAHGQEG